MIQNYGDEMLKIKNNRLYITQGQLMNATVSDGEKNIFISNVLGLED